MERARKHPAVQGAFRWLGVLFVEVEAEGRDLTAFDAGDEVLLVEDGGIGLHTAERLLAVGKVVVRSRKG